MKEKSPRLDLFIFLDAYGSEISSTFPILEDIAPYRQKLTTVLGYSAAAVPTILSGKMPRDHGHWSFFYYDPAHSPFRPLRWLRFLPKWITSRGRVRNWLSRRVKRFYGYTGYFQLYNIPFRYAHLFDYSEKKNFYDRGGLNHGRTIFDELLDSGLPFFCSNREYTEAANVVNLQEKLSEGSVPWAWLKLASLDTVIHSHGVSSRPTGERIAQYEGWVRDLLATAQDRYEEVRLYAFSDHGQVDVKSCHDLQRDISGLNLVFDRDYVASYDSTLGRFWYLRDGVRTQLEARLRELDYGTVLSEEEKAELGVDFPGNRFGQTIFLMDPAKLIVPSHMGERPITAMHGYHPDDPDSHGILMGNVPVGEDVNHIRDIYTLMRASMESHLSQQSALRT